MRLVYKIVFIYFILSTSAIVDAQLYQGSAKASANTVYMVNGKPDYLFIFNSSTGYKYFNAASISKATFDWARYSTTLPGYVEFKTDSGYSSVIDTITSNMGYRVIINDHGKIDTFRCWVVIDDFGVKITNSIHDTISTADIYCGYIDNLKASIDSVTLTYYNPLNDSLIIAEHSYTPLWTSSFADAADPDNTVYSDPFLAKVTQPYWKDTWYIIRAKDNFGIVRSDSAFYKSIQPHAEYTSKYINLLDSATYGDRVNDTVYRTFYSSKYTYISAPAKYSFTNLSVNRDSCLWIFGDTYTMGDTTLKPQPHTYFLPGDYYAKLVAYKKSDFRASYCVDTFPKGEDTINGVIKVAPPSVDDGKNAPNVLVIGTEGQPKNYDHWRLFDDVSMTDIEIIIYNRYGEKVHYFKGNIHDWDGWDGRKMGHNYVPTGVYYYVVKRLTQLYKVDPKDQTNKPYDLGTNKESRNFIHVFNVQNQ